MAKTGIYGRQPLALKKFGGKRIAKKYERPELRDYEGKKKPRLDYHRVIRDGYYGRALGSDPFKAIFSITKKPYCEHCGGAHTKNVHRFHGKGTYCATHRFGINCG